MNRVELRGNLVAKPELKFTPDGKAWASFSIGVNRYSKNSEGEWNSELDGFFYCVAFGHVAQKVEHWDKGDDVILIGKLRQSKKEGDDGVTQYRISILVKEIYRLKKSSVNSPENEESEELPF